MHLGGHDRANLMGVIEPVYSPYSIELRDTLHGSDQPSLEMHLKVIIEYDWRRNWRRLM